MACRNNILCFFRTCFADKKESYGSTDEDVYFLAEAIVAFAILIATTLICNVMIKFHEEKIKIIHPGSAN